jgi:trehalose 6-phosphate phosphatase
LPLPPSPPPFLPPPPPHFGGAVALVTGRRIADLERLLRPLRLPAAGLHGLERRRADGSIKRAAAPRWVAPLLPQMAEFARQHPGVVIENKKLSLAVHYRAVPAEATAVRQFVDACAAALEHRATVQLGKMVVELRPAGSDKGAAIAAFMGEPPFQGRVPVFLGDDLTDEHGFDAVNRLGGVSIRVGPPAETAAKWALPSVEAAHAWLAQSLVGPPG